MTTCSIRDCSMPATQQVKMRLWAKGWPKDAHSPANGEAGVYLCECHAVEFDADEWITDHGWEMISNAFAAVGRAEPDRATAEVYLSPIVEAGHA